MTVQNTHWGRIQWLHSKSDQAPNHSLWAGLSVVDPGKKQAPHIHHGVEQFIYIISGCSEHTVDGQSFVLGPGMGMYCKPGVVHEMENKGDAPVHTLVVSNPVSLNQFTALFPRYRQLGDGGGESMDLRLAVAAIKTQLNDSFNTPYAIFDTDWNLLLQNDRYPEFCMQTCAPYSLGKKAMCLAQSATGLHPDSQVSWFECPYGMIVFQIPLVYQGAPLGWIRGGHIVQSYISGGVTIPSMYDTPQSTAIGIQNLLSQIARTLLAYCDFEQARKEINRKNELLETSVTQKKDLERDLRISEDKVIGLLINRHFLFNTLNCMADMALQKKGESLYNAILSLSSMFHYTSQKSKPFVTLQKELDYIDNYLSLQKMRHGRKVVVHTHVPDELLHVYVPIDFLQPVVENAFIHGFKNVIGAMEIEIAVGLSGDGKLAIAIANNGAVLPPHEIEAVNAHIVSGNQHGLSLIFSKLGILYGDDVAMFMTVNENNRVAVIFELPLLREGFFHD